MSNILVQNIKHTNNTTSMSIDTSGQVTIRGEGSATTTNLQQGLVKVWCKFQGDAGNIFTDANFDNFNISGLTDNGTGDYTVNIDNALTNAKYSCCTTTHLITTFLEYVAQQICRQQQLEYLYLMVQVMQIKKSVAFKFVETWHNGNSQNKHTHRHINSRVYCRHRRG